MMKPQPCETSFNLDKHLIGFLQDNPFFAELSRHIHKMPTRDLPTAAVAFDEKNDELVLLWNPEFFAGMTDRQVRGVLTHEYYHLVFGHLYGRRRVPPKLWNVATDCAINSLITEAGKTTNSNSSLAGDSWLPDGCIIPGVPPTHPEGRAYSEEEKTAAPLIDIIAKLPIMMSSEWYFEKIASDLQEQAGQGGDGDGPPGPGSMDDHSLWDTVREEQREYVEGKVKSLVEKATRHADAQSNGWGNIPAEIREAIRKSVSNIVNWRRVVRQFIGTINRGGRSTSIKRLNKRYPLIHPGLKRDYEARLLIAIDMSGSVHDEMLCEFFAELGSLTKKITIDVLPFDSDADVKDIFTWRKGKKIDAKRVRCGGTDFNAPTRLANDPKNRGRWDGMLILTDGECSKPTSSRIKRGWVIGKGHKLMFDTDEIQVLMDNNASTVKGSWRLHDSEARPGRSGYPHQGLSGPVVPPRRSLPRHGTGRRGGTRRGRCSPSSVVPRSSTTSRGSASETTTAKSSSASTSTSTESAKSSRRSGALTQCE